MDIETLIKEKIDLIRPYINRHGGDIEFDHFEDGYVFVKMGGACEGCAFVDTTLEYGVEELLMEEVPGVVGVILIE
jgi:Fe-S cluster biogenesis protein NfuA